MNEELLEKDPLKKSKKFFMGIFVFALALLAIGAFASFHWLCADYFTFKANEAVARDGLRATRERIDAEAGAARKRLAEIEARVQETEAAAKKRVEESEAAAAARIADAEKKAAERLSALDEEYDAKRKRLDAAHEAEFKRLEAELEAKKHDMAFALKDYIERFNEKTNDLERAIATKRAELEETTKRISLLPDLKKQCEEAEAALLAARTSRDAAMANEREAQTTYGEWNGKVALAKAEVDAMTASRKALAEELATLTAKTNDAVVAIATADAKIAELTGAITRMKTEIEGLRADTAKLKDEKESVETEIAEAKAVLGKIHTETGEADTVRNAALEQKREAESLRDKAIAGREQAERERETATNALAKRKAEIEGLLKDMEKLLEMKKREVETVVANGQTKETAGEGAE